MKKKFIICLFFAISILNAKINFTINGDFSNFYATKTSDNNTLNIPFRIANFHSTLYMNNFEIHHTYSFE